MKFRLILMAVSAFLAVVPLSADEGKTIKRKVAIGRFSNETQYRFKVYRKGKKVKNPQTGIEIVPMPENP